MADQDNTNIGLTDDEKKQALYSALIQAGASMLQSSPIKQSFLQNLTGGLANGENAYQNNLNNAIRQGIGNVQLQQDRNQLAGQQQVSDLLNSGSLGQAIDQQFPNNPLYAKLIKASLASGGDPGKILPYLAKTQPKYQIEQDSNGNITAVNPQNPNDFVPVISGKTKKNDKAANTISYNGSVWQWNPDSQRYDIKLGVQSSPPSNKSNDLTLSDIKNAYGINLQDIKNRMMVDMTPEEQTMLSNAPADSVSTLLMSGAIGKSLSPQKKAQYMKELKSASDYSNNLINQVLKRKGVTPPNQNKGFVYQNGVLTPQ